MSNNNKCSIELIFRPSVPDNITNIRVFDDDEHIINFLTNEEAFKEYVIDEEERQSDLQNEDMFKGNFMPKGVRTLEGMFDLQNKFTKPTNVKTNSSSMQYELVNLGSEVEPKYVNLGKCCLLGERCKFIKLFHQYKEIFSCMYEYMNTYDICIIQHVISINIGINPF